MLKNHFVKRYQKVVDKGVELGMNGDQLNLLIDARHDGYSQGLNWGTIWIGAAAIVTGVLYEFVAPGVKKLFSKNK